MPFIEVAMNEAQEKGLAPEARYDLRVINAKYEDTRKGDRKKLSVILEIMGGNYEPVFETFVLPNASDHEDDDGRNADLFIMKLKRFLYLFGVTWEANGFDDGTLAGRTAEAVQLYQEHGDDGVDRNKIKYPRIPEGM